MSNCKNALFARFLRELESDAVADGRAASAEAFARARVAVEKYPIYLLRIDEAKQYVDGMTEYVCKKLSEKFHAWTLRHPGKVRDGVVVAPAENSKKRKRAPAVETSAESPVDSELEHAPTKKSKKEYIPKFRSGGWAILVGIYREYCRRSISPVEDPEQMSLFMSKEEVIRLASAHTNASFVKEAGTKNFYTAWNSHETLVHHGLLRKTQRPARYALTDIGHQLASKLYQGDKVNLPDGSNKENETEDSNVHDRPNAVPPPVVQRPPLVQIESISISTKENNYNSRPVPSLFKLAKQKPASVAPPAAPAPAPAPESPSRLDSFRLGSITPIASPAKKVAAVPSAMVEAQTGPLSLTRSAVRMHMISDVFLVVDNREKGKNNRSEDATTVHQRLQRKGVKNSFVRQLLLGDFLWVGKTASQEEIVLDAVVERKKLPDLIGSIVDKRYKEQKFRLKKSGIENVFYLVEGQMTEELFRHTNVLKADGVESALASTQMDDEFNVVRTNSAEESYDFLKSMTQEMIVRWRGKTVYTLSDLDELAEVVELKTARLEEAKITSEGKEIAVSQIFYSLDQFNKLCSKTGNATVGDMFAQQLMALCRCSPEAALAITKVYPTMQHLHNDMNRAGGLRRDQEAKICDISLRNGRRIGPKLAKAIVSFVVDKDPNVAH